MTPSMQTFRVVAEIGDERIRQLFVEEHTHLEDDRWCRGQLANAAAYYAVTRKIRDLWPWQASWNKRRKHNRRRQLVIAAALIVAEIERIDRKSNARA